MKMAVSVFTSRWPFFLPFQHTAKYELKYRGHTIDVNLLIRRTCYVPTRAPNANVIFVLSRF